MKIDENAYEETVDELHGKPINCRDVIERYLSHASPPSPSGMIRVEEVVAWHEEQAKQWDSWYEDDDPHAAHCGGMLEAHRESISHFRTLAAPASVDPVWNMSDGRPIFGEGSPHNIGEYLKRITEEAVDPVGGEVEQLLTDMRCQVSWSHVATMPIPLYERMKKAIAAMTPSVQRPVEVEMTEVERLKWVIQQAVKLIGDGSPNTAAKLLVAELQP